MGFHGSSWAFRGFHVRFWFDLCFFVPKKLGNVFPIFFVEEEETPPTISHMKTVDIMEYQLQL